MKRVLLSILGVSLLLLGSCVRETPIGGKDIPGGKMRLTVDFDDLERSGGATRAERESEIGEDRVNSLYLLFFDGSSNGSGTFKAYTEVEMPEPDPESNPDGNYSMNLEAIITYPAGTSNDEDYSILAIANIAGDIYVEGTIDEWMEQWQGKTESYVAAHAKANIPEGSFSSSMLLMHGSQRKPAGDNQVHIMLSRDVARIDVTKASTLVDWDIASVSVWNSFPETYIWGSGIVDYTDNTERVRRHYAVTPNTDDGNIQGGLYAFENQVGRPEYDDHVSTCLIIGLQPSAGGDIEYFRVNVHNDTGAQNILRNHVYNILINGKTGTGENNEETAYLGQSNRLIYSIDEWGEPDNELVVKDRNSTMSIPTKTVNMGKKADVVEIKIHTFSVLPSPSPLKIRNQTYSPALNSAGDPSIEAHLDGNTLVIESTDLDLDETPRKGVIVLSYAGLEIAINVSQAGKHDHFLIVTEPDGGILPFAAYAGIPSGLIRVQASGHWTAKLHMTGFSFDSSQASDPVKMIWTNPVDPSSPDYKFTDGRGYNTTMGLITPDETDSTCDKFRVYTHSHNMGQRPREAFILIELDELPDQYAAVIPLSQNFVKNLHYVHSASDPAIEENRQTSGATITFDGTGSLPTVGSYQGNSDWWYVFSGYEVGTTKILPWDAVLVIAGGADDRNHFRIVRNVDEEGRPISSGAPEYDPNATNYDIADVYKNKVKIKALGMNISGRDYRATLRVQTDPGTFADIEVVQKPARFELSPSGLIPNKVSHMGGTSDKISLVVENGEGLKWKINSASDIIFTEAATKTHSRRLVNYGKYPVASGRANEDITLVIVDESGNPTGDEFAFGREYDINKSFRVKFPQIYFPNRDIQVTASVTVTVNSQGATSGGMRETVRVAQNALTARPIQARTNTGSTGYASIYGTDRDYVEAYKDLLTYVASDTGGALVTSPAITTLAPEVNYVHRTNQNFNNATTWTESYKLLGKNGPNQGVLAIFGAYDSPTSYVDGLNTFERGWTFAGNGQTMSTGDFSSVNYAEAADTKLGELIFFRAGTVNITGATAAFFDVSGNADHSKATSWPASAVRFLSEEGSFGIVVIDPKDRVLFVGEDEAFSQSGNQFQTNVFFWIAYAAQYGSGFSDLLVDDETETGGGMPAPWDEWWGANAIGRFDTYNY